MKLISIAYVGLKPSRNDSIAGVSLTGRNLVWVKDEGTVHNVSEAHAALLLKHADIWAAVGEVEADAKPEEKAEPAKKKDEELFANVNLVAMSKAALVQYAQRTFNVTFDKDEFTQNVLVEKVSMLQKQHTGLAE